MFACCWLNAWWWWLLLFTGVDAADSPDVLCWEDEDDGECAMTKFIEEEEGACAEWGPSIASQNERMR
jgi:hypothetical protein